MKILSSAIKCCPEIVKFDFEDNRISEQGAEKLILGLNKKSISINLANNNIGKKGSSLLSSFLASPN